MSIRTQSQPPAVSISQMRTIQKDVVAQLSKSGEDIAKAMAALPPSEQALVREVAREQGVSVESLTIDQLKKGLQRAVAFAKKTDDRSTYGDPIANNLEK